MVNYGNNISEFVRRYREFSGFTQGELGKLLGYGPQYVCNIEKQRAKRPIGFCRRLMKKLDIQRANHLEELIKDALICDVDEKIRTRSRLRIK